MRRRHCLGFLIALDHRVLGHIPRYLHWIVYLSLYPHSTPRRRNRSDTFPLEPIALSFDQLLIYYCLPLRPIYDLIRIHILHVCALDYA